MDDIEVEVSQLDEYEYLFLDIQAVLEEESMAPRKLFLKKWCSNAKRWFVKRMYYLLKELTILKDLKAQKGSPDWAAQQGAKFHKDMQKYGGKLPMQQLIEDAKKKFIDKPGIDQVFDAMGSRLLYHSGNRKSKGPYTPKKYDPDRDYLKNTNPECAFGVVVVICGGCIYSLPIPGAQAVGKMVASTGISMIIHGYYDECYKPRNPYAYAACDGGEIPVFPCRST